MKKIVILILSFYKKIVSPILEQMFGKACRFETTCSEYAIESVTKHGTIKGGRLAITRLLKCNSWFGNSQPNTEGRLLTYRNPKQIPTLKFKRPAQRHNWFRI